MSRKGGYKIIDLKGLDFSSNMVIDGIHESIEDNYGKPLLFSGIVIDGVEKDDVFANAVVNGDGYDVTLYGQTLHISNVDVVGFNKNNGFRVINASEKPEVLLNLPKGFYAVDCPESIVLFSNKPLINLTSDESGIVGSLTNQVNGDENYNEMDINENKRFYALVEDTFIIVLDEAKISI